MSSASVTKVLGQEQIFTSANTFSSANSTMVSGWNIVRVINISTTAVAVITVNTSPVSNISILPLNEIIVKKAANTTMTASSANLLGVSIAYESN